MAIYKRGGKYWFEFVFEGRRVRRPTKTGSRKAEREIESAYRVKLAKGEVGLEEPKRIPTFATALKEFSRGPNMSTPRIRIRIHGTWSAARR